MLYQIVLESTDSATDEQSNESSCSLQAEPTASAKDSSDIPTEYSSEFELASSSEIKPHPWSFSRYDSSPGYSSHLTDKSRVLPDRVFADESGTNISEISTKNSDSDTDDDIRILKFPRCIMCSTAHENSFFQFCHSCYKIRKDFFPEKPKPKKIRRSENSTPSNSSRYACKRSRNAAKMYFENETHAKAPKCVPNIANGQVLDECNIYAGTTSPNCTQDSGIGTNNTPDGPLTGVKIGDKCLACSVNDTNALFLHGKTGHKCCCYQCAKRIWFETRRCPICRSKVNNIIRILNS